MRRAGGWEQIPTHPNIWGGKSEQGIARKVGGKPGENVLRRRERVRVGKNSERSGRSGLKGVPLGHKGNWVPALVRAEATKGPVLGAVLSSVAAGQWGGGRWGARGGREGGNTPGFPLFPLSSLLRCHHGPLPGSQGTEVLGNQWAVWGEEGSLPPRCGEWETE